MSRRAIAAYASVAVIAIGAVAVIGVVAEKNRGADRPAAVATSARVLTTTPPTPTSSVRPSPTPPPGPATAITRNGTYLVGADIQPGTWRTTGTSGSLECFWSRLSALTGELDAIIANGSSDGPQVVTIKPGDKAFSVQGCSTWTLIPG
ncbi:hypothetical protein [Nocardia sp. NPDC004260]